MSGLRLTLVALLVMATALFAAGVIAERSQTEGRAEPASVHAREAMHQIDESRSGLAILAIALAVLHLAAAAVAARLAARERAAVGPRVAARLPDT